MDKRYQVFVSSTYADLQPERQKVIQVLMEMDCIPAGMELFPAADEEQWEFIKKVINDCDYYILIIGGRYGSLTTEGISYTEQEYDYAISNGLKVLAFVHEHPEEIPVGKSDIEASLRAKLDAFRTKVSQNRLVKLWQNSSELPGLVALSLSKTIKVYPAVGWVRASGVSNDALLVDLNELRKENEQLRTKLAENQIQVIPEETNLAPLEDQYQVTLEWEDYQFRSQEKTKVVVTWAEMFALIGPDLLEHPSDGSVNFILGSALYRKKHNGDNNRSSVKVHQDDFKTIRVQFSALGLTSLTHQKSTQGDMVLFWNLTPKGNNLMVKLRTVKSTPNK